MANDVEGFVIDDDVPAPTRRSPNGLSARMIRAIGTLQPGQSFRVPLHQYASLSTAATTVRKQRPTLRLTVRKFRLGQIFMGHPVTVPFARVWRCPLEPPIAKTRVFNASHGAADAL